jgi:hypothetical protein
MLCLAALSRPDALVDDATTRRAMADRFWDAVREGQREAEAQCSSRDP